MTQYCCKWNGHVPNLLIEMENLKATESYVDVTLVCDGHAIKVHKLVLAACSKLFHEMFLSNPCTHPIILLQDMKFYILEIIVNFMYHGEINVQQDDLDLLLKAAKALQIKDLSEICKEIFGIPFEDMPADDTQYDTTMNELSSDSQPVKKKMRTESHDVNMPYNETNENSDNICKQTEVHDEVNPPVSENCSVSVITNSNLAPASNQLQSKMPTPIKKNVATSYELNPTPGNFPRFRKRPLRKKIVGSSKKENGVLARKRSYLWKSFRPVDDSIAECNACSATFSYKSSLSNLKKHLMAKHPSFQLFAESYSDDQSEEERKIEESSSEPADKTEVTTENPESSGKPAPRRKTSHLWKYFTRYDNMIAQCNMCLVNKCFRSSITNLKKHLERRHPSIDLEASSQNVDESDGISAVRIVKTVSQANNQQPPKRILNKHILKGQKTSYLWNFFTPAPDSMAECNICLKTKSYKTSISNLKKHLLQKHPSLDLQSAQELQELAEKNRYKQQIMAIETETKAQSVTNEETTSENSGITGDSQDENNEAGSSAQGKKYEKKKKSYLWNFFEPLNDNDAVCKICSVSKSYRSSISNLKKHLQRAHPSVKIVHAVQDVSQSNESQNTSEIEMVDAQNTDENYTEIAVETHLVPAEGSSTNPIVLKLQ